jgi:prophage antirepressor-like protein
MNEVMIFNSKEFGEIRTVTIDGEPWFVGNDVAKALGYSKVNEAVRTNVDKEDTALTGISDANNHTQQMVIVNESGIYSLIFGSRLKTAKKFKRWVTSEVLPALRKTGSYEIQRKQDSYMIEDPVERAKRWIEEQEEKIRLEEKVKNDTPKVEYFDSLVDSNLLTNFRDAAKELGYSQNEFVGWLATKGYIYKDSNGIIKPYEKYRKQELFALKDFKNPYSGFSGVRTYVTVKGKNTFRLLMQMQD